MRYFFFNRILRTVLTLIADNMRMTGRHLVGVLAVLVVISTAVYVAGLGRFLPADGDIVKTVRFNSNDISSTPWRRHIQNQCQRHNRPTTLDKIEPKLLKHFLVDDKHKLIYCQIPKVATTTWRRIFIILTGKAGTTDPMALAPNDVHHKHDKLLTYLSDLPKDQIRHRLQTYFKFVFVREPLERVLSAFINKFDKPYKPLSYFQDTFAPKIIKRYRQNQLAPVKEGDKVTFSEFVDYIVDPKKKIPSNEHWDEFYKLCLPCRIDYNFIGKLESIQEDSEFLLEKSGLNSIIKFPSRRESRYRSNMTNTYLKQYYSQISKNKLDQLRSVYQEDSDIFNYTLPEDVKELM